jgi:hypothetical protein
MAHAAIAAVVSYSMAQCSRMGETALCENTCAIGATIAARVTNQSEKHCKLNAHNMGNCRKGSRYQLMK